MPKWDGLRPLPEHVLAPLLRALACIPRTADTRLLLRKVESGRPPGRDAENDFDVLFRGRRVGRIWRYDYTGKLSGDRARFLWHWYFGNAEGRKDTEATPQPSGRDGRLPPHLGRSERKRAQHHAEAKG